MRVISRAACVELNIQYVYRAGNTIRLVQRTPETRHRENRTNIFSVLGKNTLTSLVWETPQISEPTQIKIKVKLKLNMGGE